MYIYINIYIYIYIYIYICAYSTYFNLLNLLCQLNMLVADNRRIQ